MGIGAKPNQNQVESNRTELNRTQLRRTFFGGLRSQFGGIWRLWESLGMSLDSLGLSTLMQMTRNLRTNYWCRYNNKTPHATP